MPKSAETRVREAIHSVEFRPITLEEALDDGFGKRFKVRSAAKDIHIAGNWSDEASEDMGTQMGLVEAVLLESPKDPASGRAHLRGFTLQPKGDRVFLRPDQVIESSDTINDDFMSAGMALVEAISEKEIPPTFVIMHVSGKTKQDQRRIIADVTSSIHKKWRDINTVAAVVSPNRYDLDQISSQAEVEPRTASALVEDYRTDLLRDINPEFRIVPLKISSISHDQGAMALGRMMAGEDISSVLSSPAISSAEDIARSAGLTPVPPHTMLEFMERTEGRPLTAVQALREATDIANAHLLETKPDMLRSPALPGQPINMTASILGTSIYYHAQAFHYVLCAEDDTTDLLMELREMGLVEKVIDIAAACPVHTPADGHPTFDPPFEDKIQDLYMAHK